MRGGLSGSKCKLSQYGLSGRRARGQAARSPSSILIHPHPMAMAQPPLILSLSLLPGLFAQIIRSLSTHDQCTMMQPARDPQLST